MTAFKIVTNQTTNKNRYYLDFKRVSKDRFYDTQLLCQLKGMNYNSSLTISHKNKIYDMFSYN